MIWLVEWLFWIITSLVISASIYILFPAIVTTLLKRRYWSKCSKQNHLFFTFDDGPDRNSTLSIAEILESHGKRGIFFVVGKRAEENRDIISDLISRGHGIGLHGYEHLHPWRCSPLSMWKDLRKEEKLFDSIIGKKNQRIYRPPYGKFNMVSLLYCIWAHRDVSFWTIDPKDYQKSSPGEIIDEIRCKYRTGGVILLHDGRYGSSRENVRNTVDAVSGFLEDIQQHDCKYNDLNTEIPVINLTTANLLFGWLSVCDFRFIRNEKKTLQKKPV